MHVPSIASAPLHGKRVLIRFDGDVPISHGHIDDDYRLQAVLPTIKLCRSRQANVILLSHMGRPDGSKKDKDLSNAILAPYFQHHLGEPVMFLSDTPHKGAELPPIVLLDNLRFSKGEEANDLHFAKQLASLGDIYCDDAFAVSHRAHASIVGVPHYLPHYAGLHFVEEIEALSPLREHADAPYLAVLGGAKASDKSPIIGPLIDRVDGIMIGGLIAVTYLAAMGYNVGAHSLDLKEVKLAQAFIRRMHEEDVALHLPVDYINQHQHVKPVDSFTRDDLMLDIGPETQHRYKEAIMKANTVFWNGAMGKFEDRPFAKGTVSVGHAIGHSHAETRVASGGDTVSAIHAYNLEKAFTFISTGGGASLEFLAGKDLPGIEALQK